jgi:hypothetical protein
MSKEAMKLQEIMEQAQVFASAWSLVGGRFDGGNAMDDAEVAKNELRQMIEEALAKQEQGEPLEYWNAVEGWVKLDEVHEHFDSVSCGTIYKNGGEGRVPLCLAQPKQEQDEPVAIVVASQYEDGSHAGNHLEWSGRNEANDFPEGTAFYTHPQPTAGQKPVGEIVAERMGVKGSDAMQVRLHFYKEIPPVGSKIYTTPQQRKPLTNEQTNKAAMKLAECMDYPWTHMPEEGKREMRKHAKAVIEAAHGIKE